MPVGSVRRKILNNKFEIYIDQEKKEIAECVICGTKLKYHHSTTTLKYHLEKKHPFSGTDVQTDTTEKSKQRTLDAFSYKVNDSQKQDITKKLCLWIARDLRPISICEDGGLQDLLRSATRDKEFKLPRRTSVSEKIQDLYQVQYAKIKDEVSRAKFITLAFDHWTSMVSDNYTGVIFIYINEECKLIHTVAGIYHSNESQTAENICNHVTGIITEWNIKSLVQYVCTDNAANMVKAAKLLKIHHLPCMAHSLQLSINHGIDQAGLSTTLAKARALVGRVRRSPLQKGNLQAVMKDSILSLIQDVPTRWGSTLDMIRRLLIQREPVTEWALTQSGLQLLTESEWRKLEGLKDLLLPCEEVCKLLGGETYVTASVILPSLALLKNKMTVSDDDTNYARKFKEGFYADISSRMSNADTNTALQIATALDIRFKTLKSVCKTYREQVWIHILNLMKESDDTIVPPASKRSCHVNDLFNIESDDDDDDIGSERPANELHELNLYRWVQHYYLYLRIN